MALFYRSSGASIAMNADLNDAKCHDRLLRASLRMRAERMAVNADFAAMLDVGHPSVLVVPLNQTYRRCGAVEIQVQGVCAAETGFRSSD
jgi:hypothetical protein